ncbi:MAG: M1 family metallopeptidase, partial [Nanopusillaceae archaeon]
KFELEVEVDKDYDVISNTEIEYEETKGDRKIVKFKETPPMSTYLLYLGIGKFDYLEQKYNNKRIRIVADKDKAKDGEFSLNWAIDVLKYFEKYSSIDYPLEKLDLIAIPDFAAGAMENWGAITFRETALLYNKDIYSHSQKLRIMEVIAHELWHQWSGNLVTMKWWDDLWLNESFATYMAYKAIDELYQDEKVAFGRMYLVDTYEAKFDDSTIYTHPISVKVEREEEIESIFDNISYGKGSNVLRMIDNYLGYDKFRVAIINYLNKYKYSNATSSDLFKEFELIGGKEIKYMIEKWINEEGLPIIEVNYNRNIISINQSRFVYGKKENKKWVIPLFLEIEGEKLNILFNKTKGRIVLKKDPSFFSLNREAIGFYVVKYNNMEHIFNGIKNKQISELGRAAILHDYYLLNLMNKIGINTLLDLIEYYRDEDYWLTIIILFNILYDIAFYFNLDYKKFLIKYKDLFYRFKDIEAKDYSSLMKKYVSYKFLSLINDYDIVEEAFNKFKSWEKLNNNEKMLISEIVGMHGGTNEFRKLLNLYTKTNNPEEKVILLRGLTSFRRSSLLLELLDNTVSGTIRVQDWRLLFSLLSRNPESIYIMYSWIKENIDEIKKYEKAYLIIRDIIESIFMLYTGDIVKNIRNYLIKHLPKYKNDIIKYSHYSEIYTNWIRKNKDKLEEML